MRKYLFMVAIGSSLIFFSNCHSSKKIASTPPAKLSFDSNVQAVILSNCSPCHIPAKGGNKESLDNYASVKENIDNILRRIQLEPGTKGFMPFKHAKLSDSTIAIFRQWKEDGLVEK